MIFCFKNTIIPGKEVAYIQKFQQNVKPEYKKLY